MAYLTIIWGWITDHATVLSAVVSAAATGFIAWFTISLVRATNQQGKITSDALRLARDEFLATHRPRLIVREVYWDPDRDAAVTIMLGNIGSRPAKVVQFKTEFDRTDQRPIMHDSEPTITKGWAIGRGSFEALTIPMKEGSGLELAAFKMGGLETVSFQGLIIYSDDAGSVYRSVFKRVSRKGSTVFTSTGDPHDEYSD